MILEEGKMKKKKLRSTFRREQDPIFSLKCPFPPKINFYTGKIYLPGGMLLSSATLATPLGETLMKSSKNSIILNQQ